MRTPAPPAWTPAGLAAATGTMFCWAAGIVLIKLTESPFMVVSFYRLAFAVPLLAVAWVAAGRRPLPWATAGVGGVLFAVHQVMHFGSLRHASAAVATILFSLQPIVVGAAGRFVTGERATARFYAWSVAAAGGCGVLVGASSQDATTTTLGTVLTVGNLLSFSAYYLATKRARERTSTAAYLLVMTVVSGLIIGVAAVVTAQPLGAGVAAEWPTFALIALVPGTIGHLLITWAHPRIHAAASSAVTLGVPVVASLGTWALIGEAFGPWQAAGGVIALGCAAAAMRHLPSTGLAVAAERYGEVAS